MVTRVQVGGEALTVGFIGLGSQGGPMARAIIDAGFHTVLWARRPAALNPFGADVAVAPSPAALAERCDVVGVCVLRDEDVEDVLLRADGVLEGARPGTIVVVHSTTHPDTCVRLAAVCAEREVQLIDAPVSGGGDAASQRRLLVMVGGDGATCAQVAPVLASFGDPVVAVGPVGAGQIAKLINNLLFTANLCLAHDAVSAGVALGLEAGALVDVLRQGSARSFALDMYAGLRTEFGQSSDGVRAVSSLLGKDAALAARLLAERGVEPGLVLAAAQRVLASMSQDG